jgi:hypothetical protein
MTCHRGCRRASWTSSRPGSAGIPIEHVYGFDEVVRAHDAMESGTAPGKFVVTI